MTVMKRLATSAFIVLTLAAGHASARWVSVDPVQANPNTGQNFNRYWYANNNPYRFTDPDGRQSRDIQLIHDQAEKFGQPELCCTSLSQEQAGVIVDFMPGFGDAKGFIEAYNNPSIGSVVGAGIGLVPIVGDLGKQLIRNADELVQGAGQLERLKGEFFKVASKATHKPSLPRLPRAVKLSTTAWFGWTTAP